MSLKPPLSSSRTDAHFPHQHIIAANTPACIELLPHDWLISPSGLTSSCTLGLIKRPVSVQSQATSLAGLHRSRQLVPNKHDVRHRVTTAHACCFSVIIKRGWHARLPHNEGRALTQTWGSVSYWLLLFSDNLCMSHRDPKLEDSAVFSHPKI